MMDDRIGVYYFLVEVHPAIAKVHMRLRRQQWALKIAIIGFLSAACGGGVGAILMTFPVNSLYPVAGSLLGVGLIVAIISLIVYLVLGIPVHAAMFQLTDEVLQSHPIEVGERFGRMRVTECSPSRLTLSLGRSLLLAGGWRLVACLLMTVCSVTLTWVALNRNQVGQLPNILPPLLYAAALAIAWRPFSMTWSAGQIEEADVIGIAVERVRWFFLRDRMIVTWDEIKRVEWSSREVILHTKLSGEITLARASSENMLNRWNHMRLVRHLHLVLHGTFPLEVQPRSIELS